MPTYLIGDITVKDPAAYEQYRVEASDLIARHRGSTSSAAAISRVISGDWRPKRLIILRFPDKASVRAYLNDPAYHKFGDLRKKALKSEIVMVDGV